jgi:hypothetical protein
MATANIGVSMMRTIKLSSGLVLAAVLACAGSAQATNLLTNGSFEDTTHFTDQGNDTHEVFPGDSTTMPGWTVFHEDISWIGPTNPFGVSATDGGYFLDLSGYHNGDPTGGVQQTLATVAGATYVLTFDLNSSTFYGIQDGVHVTAGGASADFLSTNNGFQTSLWESETMSFVATGSSTTISFLGNAGQNDVGLDNVVLTGGPAAGGAPEPAAWALILLGFGGMGAALRQARANRLAA